MRIRLRLKLACLITFAMTGFATPGVYGGDGGDPMTRLDVSYDLGSPAPRPHNLLDVYRPARSERKDRRPVVVYVHGGGWFTGDKGNRIERKAELFTSRGYVFVSVNYRLSPDPTGFPEPPAARIRFPAHPHDVGEAIGWLDRHISEYGGDRKRMILIGHSAGAQVASLVATTPSFVRSYGVEPWQLLGVVSLDTTAFDIVENATQTRNPEQRALAWNAFATPEENAVDGSWAAGSAIRSAGPKDPEFLLVTGSNPIRVAANREMAEALGQDPAGMFVSGLNHEGINEAVGDPADDTGLTAAITAFMGRTIAGAAGPRVKLTHHPRKRIRSGGRKLTVRFRFRSKPKGHHLECRLDGRSFRRCGRKEGFRVGSGRHTVRVRALSDRGRPGKTRFFTFRVQRK